MGRLMLQAAFRSFSVVFGAFPRHIAPAKAAFNLKKSCRSFLIKIKLPRSPRFVPSGPLTGCCCGLLGVQFAGNVSPDFQRGIMAARAKDSWLHQKSLPR